MTMNLVHLAYEKALPAINMVLHLDSQTPDRKLAEYQIHRCHSCKRSLSTDYEKTYWLVTISANVAASFCDEDCALLFTKAYTLIGADITVNINTSSVKIKFSPFIYSFEKSMKCIFCKTRVTTTEARELELIQNNKSKRIESVLVCNENCGNCWLLSNVGN